MRHNEMIMRHEANDEPRKLDISDFWGAEENESDSWLENKREDLAITLTGMLENCNISFADLARQLDWKPSRVSRALSGRENLTIKTIAEIVRAADYDFDLVIRPKNSVRAFQPWEQDGIRYVISEQLRTCETLVERARAMFHTAEQISRRTFRNCQREEFYEVLPAKTDAANDEHHTELFEYVAA